MTNQELHRYQLRIDHGHSSVKRCRSVKDRSRLWKVGGRALVRDICCALQYAGFVFPVGSRCFHRDKLMPAILPSYVQIAQYSTKTLLVG